MDPDATLNDLRNLIDAFEDDDDTEYAKIELIAKFRALDAWLVSGGFLPTSWDLSVKRPVTLPFGIPHDEAAWCDRCAKGDHNFHDPKTREPIEFCACCGTAETLAEEQEK